MRPMRKVACSTYALQKQVAVVGNLEESHRPAAVVAIAQNVGFDFNVEELRETLSVINRELADEDLQRVAGGNLSSPITPDLSAVTPQETNRYTMLSNIMKSKHDTETNTVSDIR